MVLETRVIRTGGRWNNRCFDRGCKRIPLLTLQQAVGTLRRASYVRRGLHAAYGALNRFLTSSEESPYYAEPRGAVEEANWLYHLLWGWVEVIRLGIVDPGLWKAAMTTTSLRALSLRERFALPGFTDTIFVIAGDSNEHVLFTLGAREEKCSFVFWTEDMEERVLSSLTLFGMTFDEHDGMIIATKELIGPVVALYLWGANHQGRTAAVINDNQNACCWINSHGSCRNPITQYLIFVLTRACNSSRDPERPQHLRRLRQHEEELCHRPRNSGPGRPHVGDRGRIPRRGILRMGPTDPVDRITRSRTGPRT